MKFSFQGRMIVCGFGPLGKHAVEELSKHRIPFTVIEKGGAGGADIGGNGSIDGDPADESALKSGGIEKAVSLIAACDGQTNGKIVAVAKKLNPKLRITASADDLREAETLTKGGARVVGLYSEAARRLVNTSLCAENEDAAQIRTGSDTLSLKFEEVVLGPASALVGKTVRASVLESEFGVVVIAIKKKDGNIHLNTGEHGALFAGDCMIIASKSGDFTGLNNFLDAK